MQSSREQMRIFLYILIFLEDYYPFQKISHLFSLVLFMMDLSYTSFCRYEIIVPLLYTLLLLIFLLLELFGW